jgi:hypothetical protein
MPIEEIFKIAIAPILTVVLLLYQTPFKKFNARNVSFCILILLIMSVSTREGCDKYYTQLAYEKDISKLEDSLQSIKDTLTLVKDTLLKVGLSIDEKTGRLLIMDSQLLKKEFTKVFNITVIPSPIVPTIEGIADSNNYTAFVRNDSFFAAPKVGTWVRAYYAHDTSRSELFIKNFTEGMGTPNEVDKFVINGRTYNTHMWKINDRTVYKGSPMRLNIAGYENRYIIFGEEGNPAKRWIFRSGKVYWIPDT